MWLFIIIIWPRAASVRSTRTNKLELPFRYTTEFIQLTFSLISLPCPRFCGHWFIRRHPFDYVQPSWRKVTRPAHQNMQSTRRMIPDPLRCQFMGSNSNENWCGSYWFNRVTERTFTCSKGRIDDSEMNILSKSNVTIKFFILYLKGKLTMLHIHAHPKLL